MLMQTRSLLVGLGIVVVASIAAMGCKKDDSDNSKSSIDKDKLIGSWISTQLSYKDEKGKSINRPVDAKENIFVEVSKTKLNIYEVARGRDACREDRDYTVSGNKVHLKESEICYEQILKVVSVADKEMVIAGDNGALVMFKKTGKGGMSEGVEASGLSHSQLPDFLKKYSDGSDDGVAIEPMPLPELDLSDSASLSNLSFADVKFLKSSSNAATKKASFSDNLEFTFQFGEILIGEQTVEDNIPYCTLELKAPGSTFDAGDQIITALDLAISGWRLETSNYTELSNQMTFNLDSPKFEELFCSDNYREPSGLTIGDFKSVMGSYVEIIKQ